MPPLLLGLPGDNTYANYAEANRAFWRQSVLPLANRTLQSVAHWLSPSFGVDLRLEPDLDRIEALVSERTALWQRVGAADFLDRDEKRAAVGYGPGLPDAPPAGASADEGGVDAAAAEKRLAAAKIDRLKARLYDIERRYSPGQPRDDHGRWTSGGGAGVPKPISSAHQLAQRVIFVCVPDEIFRSTDKYGNKSYKASYICRGWQRVMKIGIGDAPGMIPDPYGGK